MDAMRQQKMGGGPLLPHAIPEDELRNISRPAIVERDPGELAAMRQQQETARTRASQADAGLAQKYGGGGWNYKDTGGGWGQL